MGGGQQPQGTGFFDKASGMFKQAQLDPMFQMGLSLLANSRPSLKPQSFAGNLGMAGLQTIGMQQQQKMDDVKRKLLEAQAGLYKSREGQGLNPTAGNVQSTFRGENGNMWYITRAGETKDTAGQSLNPTAGNVQSTFRGENGNMWYITRAGETKDTGVPFSENVELVTQADKSVLAIDRTTGKSLGYVVDPSQCRLILSV
jgi:hypothetical protein